MSIVKIGNGGTNSLIHEMHNVCRNGFFAVSTNLFIIMDGTMPTMADLVDSAYAPNSLPSNKRLSSVSFTSAFDYDNRNQGPDGNIYNISQKQGSQFTIAVSGTATWWLIAQWIPGFSSAEFIFGDIGLTGSGASLTLNDVNLSVGDVVVLQEPISIEFPISFGAASV